MRRILIFAVAILGFAAPVATASSINAHALTVTPTHAVIRVDPPVISFFTADVFVDYGTTAAYGSTAPGRTSISGTVTAEDIAISGLTPGTTYHLRGRLEGFDQGDTALTTLGTDTVFTTPKLGGLLLPSDGQPFQSDTLEGADTPASFLPSHGSGLHACGDTTEPPAGDLSMSRFRGYALTNPAAATGCVTVQVTSSCVDLRILAYKALDETHPAVGVIASDTTDQPNHELQFPVGKDETFFVGVADDGSCSDYTIAVYSTTVASPVATTAKATAVGVRSATLQGVASSLALHGITARFQWGTTAAYGQTVPLTLPLDTVLHKYAPRLRGLKPNTVYHARIVTTGPTAAGTVTGADITFRTLAKQVPLKLQSTSIIVKSNSIASVKISCPATTVTCAGSVVLRRTTGKKPKVGSKSFVIAGGQTATVAVKLSSSNRKLVKKLRTLKVTAALAGRDGDAIAFPAAKPRAKLVWRG